MLLIGGRSNSNFWDNVAVSSESMVGTSNLRGKFEAITNTHLLWSAELLCKFIRADWKGKAFGYSAR